MNFPKIVIMDFATSEVHIFSYDPNIWELGEHFLTEHFSEEVVNILIKAYVDIQKRKISNQVVLASWFEQFKKK